MKKARYLSGHWNFQYKLTKLKNKESIKIGISSLVFTDGRLKNCFSFTRDSYKGFLLRHYSFSYVKVSQKMYTRDEGTIYCVKVEGFLTANDREKAACKGECEARRKSVPN